jgi:hypothetical protein
VILLIIALAVVFVWAVVATASIVVARAQLTGRLVAKQAEIDALKKVGKWYEERNAELENETRSLAEQVVAGGSVVRHAMPLPGDDPVYEYAFDTTGLVAEKLDPRDLPVG